MWRLQLGAGQGGLFAGFGLKIRRWSFRRLDSWIVVSQPLFHRFSLRQWGYTLPAGTAGANDVFRHKVVIGIVNVDYVAGLRALTMIGIADVGVVMVLH
jgi:hypothetical protein